MDTTDRFPLSKIIGPLKLPEAYPAAVHLEIHRLAQAKFQADEVPESIQSQFRMAMNSIPYRYKSFVEASEEFSQLVVTHGAAPAQPQRYSQERAFFEFVMTANSCLEALAYALFACGSVIAPDHFPFEDDQQRRGVNIRSTARAYHHISQHHQVAHFFTDLSDTDKFSIIRTLRRILYHRGLPGRLIIAGSEKPSRYHSFADIEGIDIQPESIDQLCRWVQTAISNGFAVIRDLIRRNS